MALTIDDERRGEAVVIHLSGRLDTQTSKTFEDHLRAHLAAAQKKMIVDLEKVDYVSSYGLRVFLLTAKQLRADRNAFILAGLTADVRKIFQISGFDKILTICPTVDDAIALSAGVAAP